MSAQTSGQDGPTPVAQLTTTLARVHGMLLSEEDSAAAVERLALVARDLVPSSVGAGASLMDQTGQRTSTGTTDKVAAAADVLQYELGEGPCLSAWATTAVQHIHDTATESRWRTWCAAVQGLGVRSVLSAPMVFKGNSIGAMKVYSTTADSFDIQDEHRLLLLAGAAATLLGVAQGSDAPQRLSAGLQAMLEDRQAVETATGMLMERHHLDHDTARSRLLETARSRRLPVAQLARTIVTPSIAPRA